MQSLQHFIAELQRRKVLRVAATYLVVAWVVLQVAVALQTAWALSAAFSGTILNLLIIGFPAVVGLAWFFEITPAGIKRTAASGDGAIAKLQTTDFVLAGALTLVFCIGVAQFFWPREAAQEVAGAPGATTAGTDDAKPRAEPPRLGDKSIAVLPFANLSPDRENEYFADGLTEELLNLLAKIGDLKVVSRTSSFAFKGKNAPLPEIARTLGVRYVLEGTVRAAGDDIRVAAQLIDVSSDTHLWSEVFERKIENIFALQDEIAHAIGEALRLEVTLTDRATSPPTRNLEAYRLYLEGLNLYRNRALTPDADVLDRFRKAVALDPKFAEAHAALGASLAAGITFASSEAEVKRLVEDSRASAEAAIKLKPTVGTAYAVLAFIARRQLNWSTAMANAKKAVELDPSDSLVRYVLGNVESSVGRTADARATFAEVRRIDPLLERARLGLLLTDIALGNDVKLEAERLAESSSSFSATTAVANWYLTVRAYDDGDPTKAERHYRLMQFPSQRDRPFVSAVAKAFHSADAIPAAVRALQAEAVADPTFYPGGSYAIFRAFDRFYADTDKTLTAHAWWKFDQIAFQTVWAPRFKSFRTQPRFKQLLTRLGLVDYWKTNGWPDRCRAKGEDDFECS